METPGQLFMVNLILRVRCYSVTWESALGKLSFFSWEPILISKLEEKWLFIEERGGGGAWEKHFSAPFFISLPLGRSPD